MATQKNLIHTELLATDNTSVPVDRAAASIQKFDKAAQKANKGGLRLMRGGLGQLGHQVQDIAVQLQMGQNAMLVFGQQGSQIASLMGPNGAIIGAVLAVGAAIGTSLAPALFNTRKHLEEFQEVISNVARVMNVDAKTGIVSFTDEIVKLGQKSEELAKGKLELALVDAILSVETASDGAKQAIEEFNLAMGRQGNLIIASSSIKALADDMGIAEGSAKKLAEAALAANFDIGADKADELNQKIKAFRKGIEGSGPALTTFLNDLLEQKLRSGDSAIALGTASAEIINYVNELDRNNKIISTANGLLDTFNEELGKNPKAAEEAAKKIEQFADKLQSAFRKSTGLTSAQILGLELQTLKELEPAQADRLAGMIREMRQTEINEQAAKNAAEAEKKRNKELAEEDRAISQGSKNSARRANCCDR
jgi:CRP-like cAMP-binding protein